MANPHNPVTIVTGGGNLVTAVTDGGNPVTAVTDGGNPVTLTTSGMNPVTFIGGVAPAPFAPSDIASLQIEFEGCSLSGVVADSAQFGDPDAWNDTSGALPAANAAQTVTANKPVFKDTGLGNGGPNDACFVVFDGVASPNQDYLQTALLSALPRAITLAPPFHIFTVIRWDGAFKNNAAVFDGRALNSCRLQCVTAGNLKLNGATASIIPAAPIIDTWYIVEIRVPGDTTFTIRYLDKLVPSILPNPDNTMDGATLGDRGSTGNGQANSMAGWWAFSEILSAGDITNMRNYLATEYDLIAPST